MVVKFTILLPYYEKTIILILGNLDKKRDATIFETVVKAELKRTLVNSKM